MQAAAPTTPTDVDETEEAIPEVTPAKSKGSTAKGRSSTAAISKTISRLSPDIVTSPANRGPPEFKTASALSRNRSSSTSNKQLPALISAVKVPARKSVRQTRARSTEQPIEEAATGDEKLHSKTSTPEKDESSQVSDSNESAATVQISIPLKKRATSALKGMNKC